MGLGVTHKVVSGLDREGPTEENSTCCPHLLCSVSVCPRMATQPGGSASCPVPLQGPASYPCPGMGLSQPEWDRQASKVLALLRKPGVSP